MSARSVARCRVPSAPGQAEHPFGDDVALDLRRPAGDGPREGLEPLHEPGLVVAALRLYWVPDALHNALSLTVPGQRDRT